MKTTQVGIDLIKQFEGLVDGDPKTPGLDPYICPTGYVTIGYGHVVIDPTTQQQLRGRAGIERAKAFQKSITPEEANTLLEQDLVSYERDVLRLTSGITLNVNQFSALVSFTFNLGASRLQRSTLLKHLKAGDFAKAADEFPKWVKGDTNGDGSLVTLPGLVRRRESERQLFMREVKPLSKSRTILASAGALAATAGGVVAEITTELTAVNTSLEANGTELDLIKYGLAALAVLGAGFAIYARINDRVEKGH